MLKQLAQQDNILTTELVLLVHMDLLHVPHPMYSNHVYLLIVGILTLSHLLVSDVVNVTLPLPLHVQAES